MRFASGALGTFIMSDAGASPWAFEAATAENPAINVRGDDPLRFIGTIAAMSFPSLQMWSGLEGSPTDWQHPMQHHQGPTLPKVDAIKVQLDRFAAIVQGSSDDLLATGQDGRRTMLVLDAVQRAAATGQTQSVGQ